MYHRFPFEGDILECMRRLICFLTLLAYFSHRTKCKSNPTSDADKRVAAVLSLERYGRAVFHPHDDFGERARYRDANAALGTPIPGERRVISSAIPSPTPGISITIFPGKEYINRGHRGQTTHRCCCASGKM